MGLAVALGLTLVAPALAQLAPQRVEGVAALVGAKAPGPEVAVILRSDVELRARIKLAGQTRGSLPLGALPQPLLQATLDELIGESLIEREARRIRIGEVPRAAVAREQERLSELAGGRARLSALVQAVGAAEQELVLIAQRRAVVAAFLASNLEGATTVTEAEVDAAIAAAGDGDPADVPALQRRLVAQRLAQSAIARGVEHWVRVLKARVPVRICARFDEG